MPALSIFLLWFSKSQVNHFCGVFLLGIPSRTLHYAIRANTGSVMQKLYRCSGLTRMKCKIGQGWLLGTEGVVVVVVGGGGVKMNKTG